MIVHDFVASLAVGQLHERTLDAVFAGRGWSVSHASDAEQRSGIDRWLERNGARLSVEYKADVASDSTGNYALELLTLTDAGAIKPGWALKCAADWLAIYRPSGGVVNLFPPGSLAVDVLRWLASKAGRISSARNKSWTTLLLLVPCKTVDATSSQTIEVKS